MTNPNQFPLLSRLRVSGRDRAKFLHNFCTNEIKALPAGQACEAFFVDVKAKTIGHGFVLNLGEQLEVWQIGTTSSALAKHLTRYIITEDVSATELPDSVLMAVEVNDSDAEHQADESPTDAAQRRLRVDVTFADQPRLSVVWNGRRLILMPTMPESDSAGEAALSVRDLSASDFHAARICERFPIFGCDLSHEHLAPEAERNAMAISYRKGCYLGQEPIARLDAMGHVNRALRVVSVSNATEPITGAKLLAAIGQELGVVTSEATVGEDRVGLAMVRLAGMQNAVTASLASGATCVAVVHAPSA